MINKCCSAQGVHLASTFDGVHEISQIRNLSPAHHCTKLRVGDQLLQVNYQTVVSVLFP